MKQINIVKSKIGKLGTIGLRGKRMAELVTHLWSLACKAWITFTCYSVVQIHLKKT